MSDRDKIWGLISDIHGNLPALEEALRVLASAGAHKLAFLGDYLGRGDSDGCVSLIRQTGDIAIVGNRDLDWRDRVSAASKAWVLDLPRTACVAGLLLTHGDQRLSPRLSTAQIPRDFRNAWAEMERSDARVWAFGHSHFARTWRKADASVPAEQLGDGVARIDPVFRYVVNVGTTGLPFPGKGGPSVAVVDFLHGEIRHLALGHQPRE